MSVKGSEHIIFYGKDGKKYKVTGIYFKNANTKVTEVWYTNGSSVKKCIWKLSNLDFGLGWTDIEPYEYKRGQEFKWRVLYGDDYDTAQDITSMAKTFSVLWEDEYGNDGSIDNLTEPSVLLENELQPGNYSIMVAAYDETGKGAGKDNPYGHDMIDVTISEYAYDVDDVYAKLEMTGSGESPNNTISWRLYIPYNPDTKEEEEYEVTGDFSSYSVALWKDSEFVGQVDELGAFYDPQSFTDLSVGENWRLYLTSAVRNDNVNRDFEDTYIDFPVNCLVYDDTCQLVLNTDTENYSWNWTILSPDGIDITDSNAETDFIIYNENDEEVASGAITSENSLSLLEYVTDPGTYHVTLTFSSIYDRSFTVADTEHTITTEEYDINDVYAELVNSVEQTDDVFEWKLFVDIDGETKEVTDSFIGYNITMSNADGNSYDYEVSAARFNPQEYDDIYVSDDWTFKLTSASRSDGKIAENATLEEEFDVKTKVFDDTCTLTLNVVDNKLWSWYIESSDGVDITNDIKNTSFWIYNTDGELITNAKTSATQVILANYTTDEGSYYITLKLNSKYGDYRAFPTSGAYTDTTKLITISSTDEIYCELDSEEYQFGADVTWKMLNKSESGEITDITDKYSSYNLKITNTDTGDEYEITTESPKYNPIVNFDDISAGTWIMQVVQATDSSGKTTEVSASVTFVIEEAELAEASDVPTVLVKSSGDLTNKISSISFYTTNDANTLSWLSLAEYTGDFTSEQFDHKKCLVVANSSTMTMTVEATKLTDADGNTINKITFTPNNDIAIKSGAYVLMFNANYNGWPYVRTLASFGESTYTLYTENQWSGPTETIGNYWSNNSDYPKVTDDKISVTFVEEARYKEDPIPTANITLTDNGTDTISWTITDENGTDLSNYVDYYIVTIDDVSNKYTAAEYNYNGLKISTITDHSITVQAVSTDGNKSVEPSLDFTVSLAVIKIENDETNNKITWTITDENGTDLSEYVDYYTLTWADEEAKNLTDAEYSYEDKENGTYTVRISATSSYKVASNEFTFSVVVDIDSKTYVYTKLDSSTSHPYAKFIPTEDCIFNSITFLTTGNSYSSSSCSKIMSVSDSTGTVLASLTSESIIPYKKTADDGTALYQITLHLSDVSELTMTEGTTYMIDIGYAQWPAGGIPIVYDKNGMTTGEVMTAQGWDGGTTRTVKETDYNAEFTVEVTPVS